MYSYSPFYSYFNDFYGKYPANYKQNDNAPYGYKDYKGEYSYAKYPYENIPYGYSAENYTPYSHYNAYAPQNQNNNPFYGFNPYYNPYFYFQNKQFPFHGEYPQYFNYAAPFMPYYGQKDYGYETAGFNVKFYDNEGEYIYECYSPYFDEGKVDVSFSTKGLKIRYKQEGNWSQDYFMVDMPMDVDFDKISATASKGYLHIKMPRKGKTVESFRKVKVN